MAFPFVVIGVAAAAAALSKKSDGKSRVSFEAKKKVKKPVNVGFKTQKGKAVAFRAKKSVTEKTPVSFRARKKKR